MSLLFGPSTFRPALRRDYPRELRGLAVFVFDFFELGVDDVFSFRAGLRATVAGIRSRGPGLGTTLSLRVGFLRDARGGLGQRFGFFVDDVLVVALQCR